MKSIFFTSYHCGSRFGLSHFKHNAAPNCMKMLVRPDHKNPKKFYFYPDSLKVVEEFNWGFKPGKDMLQVAFRYDHLKMSTITLKTILKLFMAFQRLNLFCS